MKGREISWTELKRIEVEHSHGGTRLHMFTGGKRLVVPMSVANCEWFTARLEHYLVDELRLTRKK